MLFSEEIFYTEALDLSIPALKTASGLYAAGDIPGAEKAFADYLKTSLDPERYLQNPRQSENPPKLTGADAITAGDRICAGEVCSTGFSYVFPNNEFDWEINPTFNGYEEWTWQLSRHPEFTRLADAYMETGDEKYARQYTRMISSWITQCTCPENISGYATKTWRTIEAGLRMLGNWHIPIHAFLHSPSVPDRVWVLIFRSVYEHIYRLWNFKTSHNWLIMEMGGMVSVAVLYPFFRDAGKWFRDAMGLLVEEFSRQLYPDDFQYELTTGYHGCNIGNYRNVISLCRLYHAPVPAEFDEGLHRMYRLYIKLMRPDRRTPDLNDGGEVDIYNQMKDALKDYPDDGTFRWACTDGKEGTPPDGTSLVMPYAGFAVMRTDWSREAVWGLLDAGPIGFAHQHEDKLNFLLFAYGVDMLPDSGNYAYDSSDQRRYILSTRSHNTGMVDSLGQNRREDYDWKDQEIGRKAPDFACTLGEDCDVAEGVYRDGYGSRKDGTFIRATHRRRVIFFKKGVLGLPPCFVLSDDFEAEEGNHLFEVSFQLPAAPATADGGEVRIAYSNGAELHITSDVYPTLTVGQYEPEYMGWRSIHAQGAHEHQPAPVLSYKKTGRRASFATLLLPLPRKEAIGARISRETDGFTLTVGDKTEKFLLADYPADPV